MMRLFTWAVPWLQETDSAVTRDDAPTPGLRSAVPAASAAPDPKAARLSAPSTVTTAAGLTYRRMIVLLTPVNDGADGAAKGLETGGTSSAVSGPFTPPWAVHHQENRLPREC